MDETALLFHLNPAYFRGDDKTLVARIAEKHISIDLFPSLLRYENDLQLTRKMSEVLGVPEGALDDIAFSTNVRDYVVGIKDVATLLHMKPDFHAMKRMAETGAYQHEGLMVSCLAPPNSGFDLYVRVFLPITGVNEDIACGSSNCSIVPYWYNKGLHRGSPSYKTMFPYPEGTVGFVGGVQQVDYFPEQGRITIVAGTEFHSRVTSQAPQLFRFDLEREEILERRVAAVPQPQ